MPRRKVSISIFRVASRKIDKSTNRLTRTANCFCFCFCFCFCECECDCDCECECGCERDGCDLWLSLWCVVWLWLRRRIRLSGAQQNRDETVERPVVGTFDNWNRSILIEFWTLIFQKSTDSQADWQNRTERQNNDDEQPPLPSRWLSGDEAIESPCALLPRPAQRDELPDQWRVREASQDLSNFLKMCVGLV